MEVQTFIINRITQLRLQKNVSEKQMSRELGKSPSYLSSLIRNKGLPSVWSLINICDYFEITLKEFFDEQDENPILKHEILKLLSECDEKELERIYNLIQSLFSFKDDHPRR